MPAPATADTVYGKLLPLRGISVLLPGAAVQDVLIMDAMSVTTDGPIWLLGLCDWQQASLPVISLEAMAGQPLPVRMPRSRLAVVNSLGTSLDPGLFVVLSQGYPLHLPGINRAALQRLPDEADDTHIALSHVRIASTDALIPDLERIERNIARALATVDMQGVTDQPWQPTV